MAKMVALYVELQPLFTLECSFRALDAPLALQVCKFGPCGKHCSIHRSEQGWRYVEITLRLISISLDLPRYQDCVPAPSMISHVDGRFI